MSEKIKKLLAEKNITLVELAKNVGVTEAFISYVINGYKQPSVAVFKRIADYLGVKMDDLI